jgi:dTDP-4-amino-4,6-dideoxygalactose transaminase
MNYYKRKYRFNPGDFPVSESWGSKTLSIPLFTSMLESEQEFVINVVKNKILRQGV